MYEVKEHDLKLSKKYLELQSKLDQKKFELIEQDKKVNDQTIEACLLFQSNKVYYKNLVKDLRYFDKKDSIIRSISKSFPEVDINLLEKEINKVFLSEKTYCIILISLFLFLYFLIIGIVTFILSFKLSFILTYYLPIFCVLLLIFIFIDSYIRD